MSQRPLRDVLADTAAHLNTLPRHPEAPRTLHLYMMVCDAATSQLGCSSDVSLRCDLYNARECAPSDDARTHRWAGRWRVLLSFPVTRRELDARALARHWSRKSRVLARRYEYGLRMARELGLEARVVDGVREGLMLSSPGLAPAGATQTTVFDGVDFARGARKPRAASRKRKVVETQCDAVVPLPPPSESLKKSLQQW